MAIILVFDLEVGLFTSAVAPDQAPISESFTGRFSHQQLRDVHMTITDSRLPRSKAKTLEAVGATIRIAEVVGKADSNGEPAREFGRFGGGRDTLAKPPNASPEKDASA